MVIELRVTSCKFYNVILSYLSNFSKKKADRVWSARNASDFDIPSK